MTARLVFEATQIELSKQKVPSLKLREFNYLFNKAINQYINKVYNAYDVNQQTTDDLRVLKSSVYLTPTKWHGDEIGKSKSATIKNNGEASSYLSRAHSSIQSLHGATYEVAMPIDYLHLLNCVCIYYVAKNKDCYNAGSYIEIPATRLTADSWSQIVTDLYNRPSPMKPYYYIHNQSGAITRLTNGMANGTDIGGSYSVISNSEGIDNNLSQISLYVYKVTLKEGKTDTDNKAICNGMHFVIESDKEKTIYQSPEGDYYSSKEMEHQITGLDFSVVNLMLSQVNYSNSNVEKELYKDPETGLAKGGQSGSNFQRSFNIDYTNDGTGDEVVSLVEKPIGLRAANTSNVRMEIRYGKDDSLFQLKEVQVDYVKAPQFIRLTQEQIDLSEDTSQIMEFPDYVNQEIINELVHLIMVNVNDPRLSNDILITNTIARPAQQLAQPAPLQG